MARFYTRQHQHSGLPLGALGAGSIELCPDGEFHRWQIANPERWRQDCRQHPDADDGERLAGSLSFFLCTKQQPGEETVLRRLGMGLGCAYGSEEHNYRMYSFLKPVEEIIFEGTFPLASLTYKDRSLPVEVRLKAAAPFVPFDERASGTPGIYLTFSLHNPTQAPVDIALAGKLRSIVNAGPEWRGRRARVVRDGPYTSLVLSSGETVPEAPDRGNVALSLEGEDVTWLAGEYRGYMNEYVAHGSLGVSEESFLFALRRESRLPCIGPEDRPDWQAAWQNIDRLTDGETDTLLDALERHGFSASLLERLRLAEPALFSDGASRREVLRYVLQNWSRLDAGSPWGDGALCASLTLRPGERREVRFILSWYFPSLYSAGGQFVGHIYENWFTDALDVNRYLRRERERILSAAEAFAATLYDSSSPSVIADTVSAQLSTLVKCSWWVKDGSFGLWEGLGSCGLQTMDVTYYASAGLAVLFPALQKRQMRMSAAFQREDGCVPHFFTPDFSAVDDGFDRVDMCPQFVLLVCRDYLLTGDRAYAGEMWPHVLRAMERTAGLASSETGLPDRDAGHNTYDAWHFSGASAFISILWLAALRAGALLAEVCGHSETAGKWTALFRQGSASLEKLLWNGDYYDLWVDGDKRDQCCMTDQLNGAFFIRALGMDSILPPERIRPALDAIWRYNYTEENGLVNASCPPGKAATLYTLRNCQGLANWSGIEYLMAAFYIMEDRFAQGLRIVENVWERHLRLGQVWDHAECGDHYTRPLSSWWLLQALSGVTIHGADGGTLLLAGRTAEEPFRAPWFAAGCCGTVIGDKGYRKLVCTYGQTELRRVSWQDAGPSVSLCLGGEPLPVQIGHSEAGTLLTFDPITLRPGSVLELRRS